MSYTAPNWVNGQAPALNAENLNALCQAVQAMGNGLVVTMPCSNNVQVGDFLTDTSVYGTSVAAYGDVFFGRALSVDSENHTAEVQVGGYFRGVGYAGGTTSYPAPVLGLNKVSAQAGKIRAYKDETNWYCNDVIVTNLNTTDKTVDFVLLNNITYVPNS